MTKRIHSWDLFDTLIGRKCGTAENLFIQMGTYLRVPGFVEKRRAAERFFQKDMLEYSLEDIYRKYAEMFDDPRAGDWAETELKFELNNVYPILRNVRHLAPDDIIISDMYLSKHQLRVLMQRANIWFQGEIIVSNYGKHTEMVWRQYGDLILSHCGDNQHTDLDGPKKHRVSTRPARTELNTLEKMYMSYSEDLAWWVHRHRLENSFEDGTPIDRLNLLEMTLNVPLLRAASQVLRDFTLDKRMRKLLFMARDAYMFQRMFEHMYGEIPSEYIYISRDTLRFGTDDFYKYLNSKLGSHDMLVDLACSAGSLQAALPKLHIREPYLWTLVWLPNFKVRPWPIHLEYVTTNTVTLIDNTWLEMLNYAPHYHVCDVSAKGEPMFDQLNEYDMNLVLAYGMHFDYMLQDAPRADIRNPKGLIRAILPLIHREGGFLNRQFPRHVPMEKARKQKLKKLEAK